MDTFNHLDSRPAQVVRVALSYSKDAGIAAQEIAQELDDANSCFVLLFVPRTLPLDELSDGLSKHLGDTAVFGCTTAGQITPKGYENDALLAVSFPRDHFRFSSKLIDPVSPVAIEDIANDARRMAERFQKTAGWNRLALIFADGLSKQEDILVAALEAGLDGTQIFGGSAGDGLAFDKTFILHEGVFRSNAALLLLLETDLAFRGLGFDHFQPTDKRMVVTKAAPEDRLVLEINGSPAAEEYARMVGLDIKELSPIVFAENPVLVRNQNAYHVRAIQQIAEENGLYLLSAIDDGLLLTLGRGKEIIQTMDAGLSVLDEYGDEPDFILGFDCFLRKLEIEHKGLKDQASEQFQRKRVVGFNTYGEQHRGVHVNQTFVGVAFFRPKERVMF